MRLWGFLPFALVLHFIPAAAYHLITSRHTKIDTEDTPGVGVMKFGTRWRSAGRTRTSPGNLNRRIAVCFDTWLYNSLPGLERRDRGR